MTKKSKKLKATLIRQSHLMEGIRGALILIDSKHKIQWFNRAVPLGERGTKQVTRIHRVNFDTATHCAHLNIKSKQGEGAKFICVFSISQLFLAPLI